MTRHPRSDADDPLRELLRRHDAAARVELSPHETARIRRRMLHATEESSSRLPRLAAVAALLALCLLGAWWLRTDRGPASPEPVVASRSPEPRTAPTTATSPSQPLLRETPSSPPERVALDPEPEAPEPTSPGSQGQAPEDATSDSTASPDTAITVAREIRFETPGGTRLIWLFEPEPPTTDHEGVT